MSSPAYSPAVVFGVPRSGTSWLGEILNSSPGVKYCFQPLFSYAYKGGLNESSTSPEIDRFFDCLLHDDDPFVSQSLRRQHGIGLPRFDKKSVTHVIFKEVRYLHLIPQLAAAHDRLKFVFIVRDPVSVLTSWMNAPREFKAGTPERIVDEWLEAPSNNLDRAEEFFGFRRWMEAVRIFHDAAAKYPKRCIIVRYADLKSDPLTQTQRVFDFLGMDVCAQTRDFLLRSQREHDPNEYAVFKARDGGSSPGQPLPASVVAAVLSMSRQSPYASYLED